MNLVLLKLVKVWLNWIADRQWILENFLFLKIRKRIWIDYENKKRRIFTSKDKFFNFIIRIY